MGDAEVGRLVVTIMEGADLHPSDPTGKSSALSHDMYRSIST